MIDGFKLGEYGPDFDGTELKLLNKLIYHFFFYFLVYQFVSMVIIPKSTGSVIDT
jgi:hypothetical protein